MTFLDLAEGFLHYKVVSLPFKYLGLHVGANPNKERTCDPLFKLASKRLAY